MIRRLIAALTAVLVLSTYAAFDAQPVEASGRNTGICVRNVVTGNRNCIFAFGQVCTYYAGQSGCTPRYLGAHWHYNV